MVGSKGRTSRAGGPLTVGIVGVLAVGLAPAALAGQAVPDRWPGTDPDTTEAETLTLESAVRTALDGNQQIRAARATLEEAREQASEAWGSLFPSLDLSMSYTRNVSPAVNFIPAIVFDPDAPGDELVAVQFGADNTWNGAVDLQQALFRPQAFVGVGAARDFASLQDEVLRGQVQVIVTDVRVRYFDLLLAQEEVRLTENSVRRVRQTLEETRAMYEAGLSSEYDVLRLEVELANLEPNLLRAENAVRQARRALGVTLNLDDMDRVRVAGSLASLDLEALDANSEVNRQLLTFAGMGVPVAELEPPGVDRLVQRGLGRASPVIQAEKTSDLRHTEMRAEQVTYLPEISLFGTYAVNSSQNGDPRFFGEPRAYSRQVGVQVTFPIFDGLQREARIDQRRAGLRAARAQAALARDETENEIRTLVDQVQEARARARGQRLAVTQAGRGFEIASAQYAEGIGSQLEVTDAEVALRESEFNYARAVYDFLTARARLDRAVGRVPLVDRGEGS